MIKYLEERNLFDSRLAFSRSLLAICALLFLLFNDLGKMYIYFEPSDKIFLSTLNIFTLLGPLYGKLASIGILLFVLTGYYPQLSGLLQSWVHLSICNTIIFIEGGDQIASNLSLLLTVLCLLDNRKNQWVNASLPASDHRKYVNIFANVYFYLIQIQVAVVYLHAAVGKLNKEDWQTGTALYYWTSHNVFGAPIWLQPLYSYLLLSSSAPIFSWGVIIFELGLFACILATNKYIKRTFLLSGLLFHLIILFTHGLITFFFAMSGALILYLDADNYLLSQVKRIGYFIIRSSFANFLRRILPIGYKEHPTYFRHTLK